MWSLIALILVGGVAIIAFIVGVLFLVFCSWIAYLAPSRDQAVSQATGDQHD